MNDPKKFLFLKITRHIPFFPMKKIYFILLTLLCTSNVFAGNGDIVPAPANPHGIRGVMNFTVNFRYLPTAAEVANLETELERANNILCDATDGQVVFGQVNITSGTVNEDAADIWIPVFSSRSYSGLDALNTAGGHITLFRDDIDGRVIAHELGHLAYGIHDEYRESCRIGGCGVGECILGSENATNTSLMDNFFSLSDFSEFCTAANHDQVQGDGSACNTPSTCTDGTLCNDPAWCSVFNASTNRYETTIQERLYNQSGWERMVQVVNARYGIGMVAPATVTAAQPGFCDFFLNITNEVNASDLAVLVMDVSGSMKIKDAPIPGVEAEKNRLEYAQKSAEIFVNLNAPRGDLNLGVVDFNEMARRTHPMEVLTPANRNNFLGDINGLSAGGYTAIGNGLMEARFMMEGAAGRNPTIFLLSDGESNRGLNPVNTADLLQAQGYRVFTIPVGNGADRSTLSDIAMMTGGEMTDAAGGDDLLPIYAEMAARHRGDALVLPRTEYEVCASNGEYCPNNDAQPTVDYNFLIEKNAEELVVVLTNRNPLIADWAPAFELINTATGERIDEKDKQFITDDAFYRIIRLPAPSPFDWELKIGNLNPNAANYGHVLAYAVNTDPDLFVDCAPRVVPLGEKTFIDAKALFVGSLDDEQVTYTGEVLRPDGSIKPIHFVTDIYSGKNTAVFSDMLGRGIYEVRVTAKIQPNTPLIEGESILSGDPVPPIDVFSFIRTATTSFFYDSPDFINCYGDNGCCTNDCDEDGIPNEEEDEQYPDADGDGIPNSMDEDADGDDIPDEEEGKLDLNQNNIPDYLEPAEGCYIELEMEYFVEPAPCNVAEGTIKLYPHNGSGAYEFSWSHDPNNNTEAAYGLEAGTYVVSVYDLQYGCTIYQIIEVTSDCQTLPGINCANAIDMQFEETYNYNLFQFNKRWSHFNCSEKEATGKQMLFKIVLEQAGNLDLQLTNTSGGNSDFNLYLLNDCNADACIDLTQKAELPAGTYYAVVEDVNNGNGTFELIAESSAALPLTWLNVRGDVTKMGNEISWTIADQLNISHYNIQRQDTDNQEFITIGTITAKEATEHYQFMDKQPSKESLYRIQALEFSGKTSLSNAVHLQRKDELSNALSIVPVPAQQEVSLGFNIQMEQDVVINITDITGKLMMTKQRSTPVGQQDITLNVNNLDNGVYIVQLYKANGEVLTKRMVIQR